MPRISKLLVGVLGICITLAAWGFLVEPSLLTRRDINVSHWTGPPLRIAFFADLHAGSPHIDEKYIKDLVQKINALSPDIVLIGGDLVINGVVGGHHISIENVTFLLKALKAPLGIYSVLGNHDWWNGGEKIRQTLEANGIPVLDNTARLIDVGPNFNFWLVGIGDDYTNHANAKPALSQVTSDAPRVLFMHDPSAIFQVKEKFFLALAGHMHGGQVYIPGIGAIITPGCAPKEWASGWVDFELGSLFVSKGIGTSIIPVRFNAPPEFVILELKN
jgi:predicted MPP superfamily phosphohydrolase